MSGTAMATPQVAGMAALMGQYVRENKLVEKTGKSARQLINSLLMSTATPVINGENEMPYAVIQQGAGLANVNDAINAKSFLMMDDNLSGTAADGKVKAELGDDPDRTGKYSFGFTINNLNGEQQEYTFSTELFSQAIRTVKGAEYLDTLTTPIAANVSYEVNGQTFVPTSKIVCDVNRDGVTDEKDAQLVLDSIVGLETLDAEQQQIADVSEDGKVTTYDAYLILKGLTIASVEVPHRLAGPCDRQHRADGGRQGRAERDLQDRRLYRGLCLCGYRQYPRRRTPPGAFHPGARFLWQLVRPVDV